MNLLNYIRDQIALTGQVCISVEQMAGYRIAGLGHMQHTHQFIEWANRNNFGHDLDLASGTLTIYASREVFPVPQCCERDHNRDGNCDRHSA